MLRIIRVLILLMAATHIARSQTTSFTDALPLATEGTTFVDPTQADQEFGSRGTSKNQINLGETASTLSNDESSVEICWDLVTQQNETREEKHPIALETLLISHVTCVVTYVGNVTGDCAPRSEGCGLFRFTSAEGSKCNVDDVINELQSNHTLGGVSLFRCSDYSLFHDLLPLWIVLILLCVVIVAALFTCLCFFCCSRNKKSGDYDEDTNLKVTEKLKVVGSENPALEFTEISGVRAPPDGDVTTENTDHKVELSATDRETLETGIIPFENLHLGLDTEETRM